MTYNRTEIIEYKKRLGSVFKSIKQIDDVIDIVNKELQSFGMEPTWEFVRLDLPVPIAINHSVGTFKRQRLTSNINIYNDDLVIAHIKNKRSAIFQSEIVDHIQSAPYYCDQNKRFVDISRLFQQHGYTDRYCIAINDSKHASPLMFSVGAMGMSVAKFQSLMNNHQHKISALADTMYQCGVTTLPQYFIASYRKYQQFIWSQPYNLLVTMVERDLSVTKASEKLNITRKTASSHLRKIRSQMQSRTNSHTYLKIINGYMPITLMETE